MSREKEGPLERVRYQRHEGDGDVERKEALVRETENAFVGNVTLQTCVSGKRRGVRI